MPNSILSDPAVGTGIAVALSGFVAWLGKRERMKNRDLTELEQYRKDIKEELDETRKELEELKEQRIKFLQETAIKEITYEKRIALLERERDECVNKLGDTIEKLKVYKKTLQELQDQISLCPEQNCLAGNFIKKEKENAKIKRHTNDSDADFSKLREVTEKIKQEDVSEDE